MEWRRNKIKKVLKMGLSLVFLLLLFSCSEVVAQELEETKAYQNENLANRNSNSKDWEAITSKVDYSKDKKEEKKEEPVDNTEIDTPDIDLKVSPGLKTLGQIFVIGLVICALGFLLFMIFTKMSINSNKNLNREEIAITMENIENNLHEADVEGFLADVLRQKEYRIAIRLYYLAILKELSLREHIDWKKDKTNGVYIREMRKHEQFEAFQKGTSIFEYIWYNMEDIDAVLFEKVRPHYKNLLTTIKKQDTPTT